MHYLICYFKCSPEVHFCDQDLFRNDIQMIKL